MISHVPNPTVFTATPRWKNVAVPTKPPRKPKLLRRQGVRPRAGTNQEISALKAPRGDFQPAHEPTATNQKIEAAITAVGL